MNINPYRIHWGYFKNYYKVCDALAFRGACYALAFHHECPKDHQLPCDIRGTVYIGESTGYYYDKQMGYRGKDRGFVHKRMTQHVTPLTKGYGGTTSHQRIIEQHGYGDDVLMGTLTGEPLWLCLIIPSDDVPQDMMKTWAMYHESAQLLQYHMNWGMSPIGNLDRGSSRQENSYSTTVLRDRRTLEEFMSVA